MYHDKSLKDHPAVLHSEESYLEAPLGTVITFEQENILWEKYDEDSWFAHDDIGYVTLCSGDFVETPGIVVRWGIPENVSVYERTHPKSLITIEDYDSAPNNTVISDPDTQAVLIKNPSGISGGSDCLGGDTSFVYRRSSSDLAGKSRDVLRWG